MICKEIEHDLALATMDCLDEDQRRRLQDHCRSCSSCAARWQEFQAIASAHSRAAAELAALPLHFRRTAADVSPRAKTQARIVFSRLGRSLLPIGSLAAVAIAVFLFYQPVRPPRLPIEPPPITSVEPARIDRSPSLAAYRNAIEKSGDGSLDALLARDAQHLLRQTSGRETRDLLNEQF